MAIRLWPQDFERKEHISKEEKALLRFAAKNFKAGHFAVNIDPVGLSSDKMRMGMYISPSEGLVTFSIITDSIVPNVASSYPMLVKIAEDKIYERLLDSKLLIIGGNGHKTLKFPYKHIIIFENEKPSNSLGKELEELLAPFATYSNFYPVNSKIKISFLKQLNIFGNIRKPYDRDGFKGLDERECLAIFERLAPEYTVVMAEKENIQLQEKKSAVTENDMRITGNELEYKTFYLDEYQVALVNEMGNGHRVMLANPGAGKSVILLSKAFKYASMYKDSKVLLTCYNANLADSYNFKYSCANFGDNRNLYMFNVHKLVAKIYNECLHERLVGDYATDAEFQHCIDAIKAGKITLRFKAIFIDEVQNFNPLYLELCYRLLEQTEGNLFLMAGDLNQDIRSSSRKGTVPWRQMNGIELDFRGRVRYVDKNYRNSIEIGNYIQGMLQKINSRLEALGCTIESEYKFDSFTNGTKPGLALKVKTGINKAHITEDTIAAIKEITEQYKLSYSDIAILFPFRQVPYFRYYFYKWLKNAMTSEGIPYSLIIKGDTHEHKSKIGQTSGVVISTIESSLGLDFRAVIVVGLYPYNNANVDGSVRSQISSWASIASFEEEEKLAVQKQMHQVYTACSRARDVLYVLSDLKEKTPMEEIIRK